MVTMVMIGKRLRGLWWSDGCWYNDCEVVVVVKMMIDKTPSEVWTVSKQKY